MAPAALSAGIAQGLAGRVRRPRVADIHEPAGGALAPTVQTPVAFGAVEKGVAALVAVPPARCAVRTLDAARVLGDNCWKEEEKGC